MDLYTETKERSTREDSEAKARRTSAAKVLEDADAMTVVTNTTGSLGDKKEQTISGNATSSKDESDLLNSKRNTFESLEAHKIEKENPQLITKISTIPDPETKKLTTDAAQTALDYNTTLTRRQNLKANIDNNEVLIKQQLEEQQKAETPSKKKEIQAKIQSLYEAQESARIDYTNESATLDKLIETEIGASYVSQDLKDQYTTLYNKDPEAFLRTMKKSLEGLVEYNTQTSEVVLNEINDPLVTKDAMQNFEEQQRNMFDNKQFPESPIKADLFKTKTTPEQEFALNIMKNFQYNLKASFNTVGTEVVVDAGSDKLTNGKLTELVTYIADNQRGSSGVIKMSDFNTLTGESTRDPSGNEFNLLNYEKTPHFDGKDKDGNLIDTPEDDNNHSIDSIRYVLESELNKKSGKLTII